MSVVQKKFSTVSKISLLYIEEPPSCLGVRHLQIFLLFLCMVFAYIIRVNISTAIIAMISNSPSNITSDVETFDWDPTDKSMILSAFFWGYLVMNVPAAVLGHRFNNKWLLACSFAVASLLSIATPLVASYGGSKAVICLRVGQGLAQGFMMPMIHGLQSKWVPPRERARFCTYILGGIQFGTMIVLSTAGWIADHLGWPNIFYYSGVIGLGWSVAWMLLGANSPDTHPFISRQERDFINRSLPMSSQNHSEIKIPWRSILLSGPQWAVTLAHVCQNWGIWTILTEIPTYFNRALNFNLSQSGFLEAVPFLMMWLVSFPLAYIADRLIINGVTHVTTSRKIWNTVAHFGGAAALIGMSFSQSNTTASIAFYMIAVTVNCCVYMGFNVNHLDLSPNFARILMGISNGSANITSIIAPLFVGAVVHDETDVSQWRIVFGVAGFSFFLGNIAFCCLGSGELQPWNDFSQPQLWNELCQPPTLPVSSLPYTSPEELDVREKDSS